MEGGNIKNVPAPLPTEIPQPPDLSRLPSHIIHSGTVETLIGHNEDITARLMVNIRRNSVLERQMLEQERLNGELVQINGSLHSQLEVLQEKDRMTKEKSLQVDDRQDRLAEEIEYLESKADQLELANKQLRLDLRSTIRFQRRVRTWVRPLVTAMKTAIKTETKKREIADAQNSDLKARLGEAIQDNRSLESKFLRDQTKLVEQYETRLGALQNVKEKAQRFDEAIAKRTETENKLILVERKRIDIENSLTSEIKSLQNQMAQYRQESKILAAENFALKGDLQIKVTDYERLSDQFLRIQDQFESMQAVWSESQKRIEASKIQHETLNRLNQELSRQLKENRKGTVPDANA